MAIEVTILGFSKGLCALTGRESDGLRVTFADGTVVDGFLSHRSFQQLLRMKLAATGPAADRERKAERPPAAVNGAV